MMTMTFSLQVIMGELYRNLLLATLCILLATAVLLPDLRLCGLVLVFVVVTLVNVAGFMHFWGKKDDGKLDYVCIRFSNGRR